MPPASRTLPPALRGRQTLPAPSSLSEAIRATVEAGGGGHLLAERIGVPRKLLYRVATDLGNASDEHRHLPACLIPALVRATGKPDILRALAAECGYAVVRAGMGSLRTASGLVESMAAIMREMGDVHRQSADVLMDPRNAAYKQRLVRELVDVQTETAILIAQLKGEAA